MVVTPVIRRPLFLHVLLPIGLAAGFLLAPTTAPQAVAAPAITVVDSPISEVYDAAVGSDGTTYAVGDFTQAGASTGGLARLTTTNADVDRTFPTVNGYVNSMITDSSGAIYLGGEFVWQDRYRP